MLHNKTIITQPLHILHGRIVFATTPLRTHYKPQSGRIYYMVYYIISHGILYRMELARTYYSCTTYIITNILSLYK